MKLRCTGWQAAGYVGLQVRYVGLQAGYVGWQARYVGLQAGYTGLQARYVGLQDGYTGLQATRLWVRRGACGGTEPAPTAISTVQCGASQSSALTSPAWYRLVKPV